MTMIISQRWLGEFVDISVSPKDVAHILTMLGLEVESVRFPAEHLQNIVIGEILTKEQHPNAHKLSVCRVAIDDGHARTIVCGAPNVSQGQKVPVALPGAVLPRGGLRIEKRILRGIESDGMICSQAELGFTENSDGIWELPNDAPVGKALAEYLGMDDVLYEISITPNRPDCLSHIGIARELAAYFHAPLRLPRISIQEDTTLHTTDLIRVYIEDREGCHRFAGRIIMGVTVAESPQWIKDRITACGLRPINNVVDITNYVMLECGKPIHAFDLNTIAGNTLIIRKARDGEEFITLDGKTRILDSSMTMVCDAERSSAIGGVMGGKHSEICASTVNVLIESAYFHPSSIRRTAKKLGITSDAAYRFERGVDMGTVVFAADRAAELIQQIAGGKIAQGIVDIYPIPHPEKQVQVRYERVRKHIGISIPNADQRSILERLGFSILEHDETSATYRIPSYRIDVDHEADCIEEIARLHGYDKIPLSHVSRVQLTDRRVPPQYTPLPFAEKLSSFLRANGCTEIITQTIIDPTSAFFFTSSPVRIANPLGEELSCMRPSLLPSMLKTIERNHRYGRKNLRLFELGTVFHSVPHTHNTCISSIAEEQHCVIAFTGTYIPYKIWNSQERAVDFYDAKGLLESITHILCLKSALLQPILNPESYPMFSVNTVELIVQGKSVGCAGELDIPTLKAFNIDIPVIACILNISALHTCSSQQHSYTPVSPFPTVVRDLAFVVDNSVHAERIRECIMQRGGGYLRTARVFDVFSGEVAQKVLGNGKKSIAFSLEFNSFEKTLEDTEIDSAICSIVEHVQSSVGGILRSA
ncbi:MAG: phenylalanine--tRNA ligase subunit beta [Bacteroidota bacterium]|nr:phenylalanine--tRNA ligase subunit beta [Candidatus Kapabacteria bacterium]MDW8218951.1 phenylalanine--tRNA ligase subunit beta [Bacteroidota bacterium]